MMMVPHPLQAELVILFRVLEPHGEQDMTIHAAQGTDRFNFQRRPLPDRVQDGPEVPDIRWVSVWISVCIPVKDIDILLPEQRLHVGIIQVGLRKQTDPRIL